MLISTATVVGADVAVQFGDQTPRVLPGSWLRDACNCAACRHPGSLRRITEAMDLPLGISVVRATVAAGDLGLCWSDGHTSLLPAAWLWRLCAPEPEPSGPTGGRPTWTSELNNNVPGLAYEEVTASDAGTRSWLSLVDTWGFAVVRNVPPTRESLTDLTERVGPVRASNYGVDWEIEASVAPKNAVYSAKGLSPHTDLPYREVPPGLQLLLCAVADAPGGASTLVDGFSLVDQLRAEHPADFELLTTASVPFAFVDEEYDLRWSAPIVGLRPDGAYGVIRHAPGIMSPLDPASPSFAQLFAAIHRFIQLTNDPVNQVVVRLEPGDMLTFNNHRLLHGRQPFDLRAGGRRHMYGSYADIDDLHSRLRVLRSAPSPD